MKKCKRRGKSKNATTKWERSRLKNSFLTCVQVNLEISSLRPQKCYRTWLVKCLLRLKPSTQLDHSQSKGLRKLQFTWLSEESRLSCFSRMPWRLRSTSSKEQLFRWWQLWIWYWRAHRSRNKVRYQHWHFWYGLLCHSRKSWQKSS